MKKIYIKFIALALLAGLVFISESCAKRDCRGRKKTVKTNMGGWL
jgi:hypothetical protein